MKNSKRSNGSSRKIRNRLWLIDVDPYAQEQLRLALDGTDWEIVAADSISDLPARSANPDDTTVVAIAADRLATHPQEWGALPADRPLLVVGAPALLEAFGGVDFADYLCEPWTGHELRYRLGRLVAQRNIRCGESIVSWGPYWIAATDADGTRRTAPLSLAQYATLDLLGRAPGEPVAREAIAAVSSLAVTGRALDMHLSRLRSRIRSVTTGWKDQPEIRAYRRRGYRLECPGWHVNGS